MQLPEPIYRHMAVCELADLIEAAAQDRSEIEDPGRRIYSLFREIAAEIGRRMNRIRMDQRNQKHG